MMVSTDVLLEVVVVEGIVVETADVMQVFFCLFSAWLFGGYDG